ncbi:DUF3027 domain-containing protein [Microbacterium caowuchunii]|uniref:DUF3027 domain-containing protein n=1 Tax=Microbacterium caowuchunii TaxID=2614638 RepID=A0A5N0T8P7_9MICO|nr:DUF3027 domain-containing protein [Microbacterium caowuchunii]KAA9131098.1 DUF3027 domain-containing protein [Microbacterium caowuchunii]
MPESVSEPAAEQGIPQRPTADPRLVAGHDLALAALREITPASTIGPAAGYTVEDDGVVSLRFENRLDGYPGWYWTVSLAVVEAADPTVLEAELLPGNGALLAPEWVPWATRLAEYHAQQAAQAQSAKETDSEDADDPSDDLDDVDDLDASDFDEDGSSILHAGDLDGVDIDELDDSASDEDSDDDDDDSDDDEDSDDDDDDSDDDDSDDDDDDDSDDDDDDDEDSDDDDDDDDDDDSDDDDDDDDSDDDDDDEGNVY